MTGVRVFRWPAVWLLIVAPPAWAGREITVSVRFSSPAVAPLPEEVKSIKVLKPNYPFRAIETGIMKDAELRWYQLFVGDIENAISASGSAVVFEHEDQIAGDNEQKARRTLGDEDPEAPAPAVARQRQFADATITVRFGVDTRRETTVTKKPWHKRAIEGIPARLTRGILPAPDHSPEVQHRVVVTMQCDMALTDSRTQRQLVKYSRSLVFHESTKPDIALGIGGRMLGELAPTEEAIQQLVNEHSENFVSLFLPIFRTRTIPLYSVTEDLATAVDRVNAGDVDGGAMAAWGVWQRQRRKDAKAACVLGVYWEAKGDVAEARLYYQAACALDAQNSEYKRALQRVTDLSPAIRSNVRTTAAPARSSPGAGRATALRYGHKGRFQHKRVELNGDILTFLRM